MADTTDSSLVLDASIDLSGVNKQILDFSRTVPSIKLRVDGSGLGTISRQASEFQRSIQSAQARVLSFGFAAGQIFLVTKAFESVFKAGIDVEKQLTDINVVLGLSTKQLTNFSNDLFKVASETGQSFQVAATAATEFSRQGLGVEETLKRTRDALTLTRLSGLDVVSSTEALTSAVNGFNQVGLDSTAIVNKLANVDAQFAVSSKDLAEAFSRVGATAKDTKVSFDELLGLVTAAKQITGRDGAVIGNALKTIFTRIERPQVLEDLKQIGVLTEDVSGQSLGAKDILVNLAKSYDTLSASQKNQVIQLSAGVFQANQFRAILSDLAKQNSIAARATDVAANSTDQAARRQAELNKTTAANINETINNLQNFASKAGKLTFEPVINRVLGSVNKFTDIFTKDFSGTSDTAGNTLGQGLLRGLGNYLSGPGLALGFAVVTKFFTNFAAYAGKSLAQIIEGSSRRFAQEQAIEDLLAREPALMQELVSLSSSQEGVQQRITQELIKQLAVSNQIAAVKSSLIAGISDVPFTGQRAFNFNSSKGEIKINPKAPATESKGFIPTKSVGHIPEMREKMGAFAAGYTPGEVKDTIIPRLGKVYYNTAEQIKKFPQFDQPAIMPPQSSKAGVNYKRDFEAAHGFNPYKSSGLVPNYANPKDKFLNFIGDISPSYVKSFRGIQNQDTELAKFIRNSADLVGAGAQKQMSQFLKKDFLQITPSKYGLKTTYGIDLGNSSEDIRAHINKTFSKFNKESPFENEGMVPNYINFKDLGANKGLVPNYNSKVSGLLNGPTFNRAYSLPGEIKSPIPTTATISKAGTPINIQPRKSNGFKNIFGKFGAEGIVPNYVQDIPGNFNSIQGEKGIISYRLPAWHDSKNAATINNIRAFQKGAGAELYPKLFEELKEQKVFTAVGELVNQGGEPISNSPIDKLKAQYPQLIRGRYAKSNQLVMGQDSIDILGGEKFDTDLARKSPFILRALQKNPNLNYVSNLNKGLVPNYARQLNFPFLRKVPKIYPNAPIGYHGTLEDFDKFEIGDLGFHFGTKKSAQDRIAFQASNLGEYDDDFDYDKTVENAKIVRARLNFKKTLEVNEPSGGFWTDPFKVIRTLYSSKGISFDESKQLIKHYSKKFGSPVGIQRGLQEFGEFPFGANNPADREIKYEDFKPIRQILSKKGYDSIAYGNQYEDKGSLSYIALKNSQIQKFSTGLVPNYVDFRNIAPQFYNESPLGLSVASSLNNIDKNPATKQIARLFEQDKLSFGVQDSISLPKFLNKNLVFPDVSPSKIQGFHLPGLKPDVNIIPDQFPVPSTHVSFDKFFDRTIFHEFGHKLDSVRGISQNKTFTSAVEQDRSKFGKYINQFTHVSTGGNAYKESLAELFSAHFRGKGIQVGFQKPDINLDELESYQVLKKHLGASDGIIPNYFPKIDGNRGVLQYSLLKNNTAYIDDISGFGGGVGKELYPKLFQELKEKNIKEVFGSLSAQGREPISMSHIDRLKANYPQLIRGRYAKSNTLDIEGTEYNLSGGEKFNEDLKKYAPQILRQISDTKRDTIGLTSYVNNGLVPNYNEPNNLRFLQRRNIAIDKIGGQANLFTSSDKVKGLLKDDKSGMGREFLNHTLTYKSLGKPVSADSMELLKHYGVDDNLLDVLNEGFTNQTKQLRDRIFDGEFDSDGLVPNYASSYSLGYGKFRPNILGLKDIFKDPKGTISRLPFRIGGAIGAFGAGLYTDKIQNNKFEAQQFYSASKYLLGTGGIRNINIGLKDSDNYEGDALYSALGNEANSDIRSGYNARPKHNYSGGKLYNTIGRYNLAINKKGYSIQDAFDFDNSRFGDNDSVKFDSFQELGQKLIKPVDKIFNKIGSPYKHDNNLKKLNVGPITLHKMLGNSGLTISGEDLDFAKYGSPFLTRIKFNSEESLHKEKELRLPYIAKSPFAFAKGLVPNYNDISCYPPLKQAVERENKAGIPMAQIRVGQSAAIKSSLNPLGLGVFNTKDEPQGLNQGIQRVANMGFDPKTAGATYSKGLIPNFADYYKQRSIPLPKGSDEGDEGAPFSNQETEQLNTLINNVKKKIAQGLNAQELEVTDELAELRKFKETTAVTEKTAASVNKQLEGSLKYYQSLGTAKNIQKSTITTNATEDSAADSARKDAIRQNYLAERAKRGLGLNTTSESINSRAGFDKISNISSISNQIQSFTKQISKAKINPNLPEITDIIKKAEEKFGKDFANSLSEKIKRATDEAINSGKTFPLPAREQYLLDRRKERGNGLNTRDIESSDSIIDTLQSAKLQKAVARNQQANILAQQKYNLGLPEGQIGPNAGPFRFQQSLQRFQQQEQNTRNLPFKNLSDLSKSNFQQLSVSDLRSKLSDIAQLGKGLQSDLKSQLAENIKNFYRQATTQIKTLGFEKELDKLGTRDIFTGFLPNSRFQRLQTQSQNEGFQQQFRNRRQDLQNRALTASFVLPVLGGVAEQGLLANGGDETRVGRGVARTVGGATNIASFAATGFGIAGPYGALGGGILGLVSELPSILKAFSDTLPDLERNLQKLKETAEENSTSISGFIDASEKLSQIGKGEITGVKGFQVNQLRREQFTNLAAIPGADDRQQLRKLIQGGDFTGAREFQANLTTIDQQRIRATELQKSSKAFLEENPRLKTPESPEQAVERISQVPDIANLPPEEKKARLDFVRKDFESQFQQANQNPVRKQEIDEFTSGVTSQLFSLTNKKGESFFDAITNSKNINKLDFAGKTIPPLPGLPTVTAGLQQAGFGKNFVDVLRDIGKESGIDAVSLEKVLGIIDDAAKKDAGLKDAFAGKFSAQELKEQSDSLRDVNVQTSKNIQIVNSFTKALLEQENAFNSFGQSIERSGITQLGKTTQSLRGNEIIQRTSNQISLSKSGGNPFLENRQSFQEENTRISNELTIGQKSLSNTTKKNIVNVLGSAQSSLFTDLKDSLDKDKGNLSPTQLKQAKDRLSALSSVFDIDISPIKDILNQKDTLDEQDLNEIQKTFKDKADFFDKFRQVSDQFPLTFEQEAKKQGLNTSQFAKTPEGLGTLQKVGLANEGGKLNELGDFIVNSPLNAEDTSDVLQKRSQEAKTFFDAYSEFRKIVDDNINQSTQLTTTAETGKFLNKTQFEQNQRTIPNRFIFNEELSSQFAQQNQAKARFGNTPVEQGGAGKINFGETALSGFRFEQPDIFKKLAEDTQSFGKDFTSTLSSAFKESLTSTQKFSDVLRSSFLNLATKIAGNLIDTGISSIFGATIGKLGPSVASIIPQKGLGGYIKGFARGGFVNMGSGVKDDVPAFLSGGEFVINKKAVQAIGKNNLDVLNGATKQPSNFIRPGPNDFSAAVTSDSVNIGSNSATISLANSFQLQGHKGALQSSPLLSATALTDENNPQNKLKFAREQFVFRTTQQNRQIAAERANLNKNQLIGLGVTLGTSAAAYGLTAFKTTPPPGTPPTSNSNASTNQSYRFNGGNTYTIPDNGIITSAKGGYIPRLAGGGYFGGDSSSDKFSALVMGGEYVVGPQAVQKHGVGYFEDLNKSYAGGGYVTNSQNLDNNQDVLSEHLLKLIDISNSIKDSLAKAANPTINGNSASVIPAAQNNENNTAGAVTNNVTINITSASNGQVTSTAPTASTTSSNASDRENNIKLSKAIESKVIEVLAQQSKNGGILSDQYKKK